jgi:flagellar biosynthesis component FlhA
VSERPDLPVIPITVELGGELRLLADGWRPFAQEFVWKVETFLYAALERLGIPGKPFVETSVPPAGDSLRVYVRGKLQRFPMDLVRNLSAYYSPAGLAVMPGTTSWDEIGKTIPEIDRAEFAARLVVEVIKQRPEALWETEQTDAFLRREESDLPAGRAENVCRNLLRFSLPVSDAPTICQFIRKGIERNQPDDDIVEILAPRVSPGQIEILLSAQFARRFVRAGAASQSPISVFGPGVSDDVAEMFTMLTDGIFYEVGIRVPEIVLTVTKDLKDNGFAFKLDGIAGPPRLGLMPDQFLANALAEQLKRLKIDSVSTVNPANDNECSIVNKTDIEQVKGAGLQVWDHLNYVILALARELRRNSWRLLHMETVECDLAKLKEAFPELVLAAVERVSTAQLTRILRNLLKDEVSIRDLRAILERIITFDYVVADTTRLIVFDDRLAVSDEPHADHADDAAYYSQHVRSGLKRYLSHKLTRGQNTLIVYLVDRDIEESVLEHLAAESGVEGKKRLTDEQLEEIEGAIRAEVSSLPAVSAMPVILTTSEIRAFLREMVAPEFPSLFVVSYDELSPDMNIQPIARISLD